MGCQRPRFNWLSRADKRGHSDRLWRAKAYAFRVKPPFDQHGEAIRLDRSAMQTLRQSPT
jgi:hypothetical protein